MKLVPNDAETLPDYQTYHVRPLRWAEVPDRRVRKFEKGQKFTLKGTQMKLVPNDSLWSHDVGTYHVRPLRWAEVPN